MSLRICRGDWMPELYRQVEAAILQRDPQRKCALANELFASWRAGQLHRDRASEILAIDDPGRPSSPRLVDPRTLPRRSSATPQGRVLLLHAIAHIEFNAINIALDAVYRFRELPLAFIGDWLYVAQDEARHFSLLNRELQNRGSHYGFSEAHAGLWEMVCRTRCSALQRMALVPRVMEARGLDVTPGMIARFEQAGDETAAAILEVIFRDEIEHVRIGNRWYEFLCRQQGVDPRVTFAGLVKTHLGGRLRGPFNRPARLEAGFAEAELDALEANT